VNISSKKYEVVVMGVSAGGLKTMAELLRGLSSDLPVPLVLVQHTAAENDLSTYIESLKKHCSLSIKIADEKEMMIPGYLYVAPANYHLQIESNRSFSLNADEKIKFCRPSIDVLFETAAYIFQEKAVAIILTGANDDGTDGMKIIKKYGGYTIAQDPEEAEVQIMPKTPIDLGLIDSVLKVKEINEFLKEL